MSVVRHHRLRLMVGLTWRAEYALGVLAEEGECKMLLIEHACGISSDLRTVVDSLIRLGFVSQRMRDKKTKLLSITDLGKEYLQQVEKIYGENS